MAAGLCFGLQPLGSTLRLVLAAPFEIGDLCGHEQCVPGPAAGQLLRAPTFRIDCLLASVLLTLAHRPKSLKKKRQSAGRLFEGERTHLVPHRHAPFTKLKRRKDARKSNNLDSGSARAARVLSRSRSASIN